MNGARPKVTEFIIGKPWVVRRTIWPFEDGYGTYNYKTNTVLHTGLTKEEAKERCKALNAEESQSQKRKKVKCQQKS